jgi:hypothetical protein
MAPCICNLLLSNDHISIDYLSTIVYTANLFVNHLYNPNNNPLTENNIRQIPCDWIGGWITFRYFAHWSNDVLRVGIKEI